MLDWRLKVDHSSGSGDKDGRALIMHFILLICISYIILITNPTPRENVLPREAK